jgi:hypothetical protein
VSVFSRPIPFPRRIAALSFCAFLFDPLLYAARRQSPTTAAPQSTDAQTDAAAKAAERKKRFEESKKALEDQNALAAVAKTQPVAANANSAVKQAQAPLPKVVFNIPVTLGVGDAERYFLSDEQRGNVTKQAEWTTQDPDSAAELYFENGVPCLLAKGSGIVILSAVFDGRRATVTATIIPREKMNGGTIAWTQIPFSDRSSLKIQPSVPFSAPRK